MADFKKITDVPSVDEPLEGDNLLIVSDNKLKQISASLIDYKDLETTLNGLGSKLNDMEKHAYNSRPDYNQNDETADDYIKNRPFYDTRATEEVEITFDGTLDGKEYIQIDDEAYLVKISDNAPEKESLIGGTIRIYREGTIEEGIITEDILNVESDDLYMILSTLVAINDTTFNGMSLSKGIWTILELDVYYMTYLKATKSTGELKKIDEKYLQDLDWENITNKPFYYYGINTEKFVYSNAPTSGQGAATLGSGRPFIKGETYTVTVNGESTEIVATDLVDGVLRLLYSGSSSTSNNIYYEESSENYRAWTWWSSGATVTIEGPFRDLKQIDEIYIPDNIARKSDTMRYNNPRFHGSFAEDSCNALSPLGSVAFGKNTTASGPNSLSEGERTKASGYNSHAEGYTTIASGYNSHAECCTTTASGTGSHAEGYTTIASGSYSHAEGQGTKASGQVQHAQGKYNIEDTSSKYAHIVGNGTSTSASSNAHTLDWNGIGWFKGGLQVGGNAQDDGSKTVLLDGDAIPTPETASVGQTIVVKAVDENGKPTEWESADMPEIVQPDYNQNDETASDYIKNRPFYEHIITERDMIPETSIEATTQSGDLWYQSGLSITILHASDVVRLSTVKVYFDGEVYEQVPIESTYIGGGTYLITIGNTENYPFKVDNGVAYFTTSGTHSLRVCKIIDPETEIITIPMKYLPLEEVELLGTQQRIPTGYAVWNYVTTKCLTKNNTTSYTPTSDYHPATKKYVDDVKQYVNDYTIPIPSVTEEDNNKILSVVDGKPAWITINNAEGVAY